MGSDTVKGALIAAGALVLGAVIAAAAGLLANWASHRWNLEERSAERQEVRRLALLTQRAADLRELADNLTEMVTAAKEIAWERTADGVAIQNDQYHLDLPTDGLAPGSYTIRVRFNSPALVGTLSFPMSLV